MRTIWNKFSLRLRLFLSFGVLLALMITLSLVLQSTFYAQNRVTRLLEQDMPTQLQQLSAEVTLKLAPSIEAAQSLATNTSIKNWVKNGMPASELPLLQEQMAVVAQDTHRCGIFRQRDAISVCHHVQHGLIGLAAHGMCMSDVECHIICRIMCFQIGAGERTACTCGACR